MRRKSRKVKPHLRYEGIAAESHAALTNMCVVNVFSLRYRYCAFSGTDRLPTILPGTMELLSDEGQPRMRGGGGDGGVLPPPTPPAAPRRPTKFLTSSEARVGSVRRRWRTSRMDVATRATVVHTPEISTLVSEEQEDRDGIGNESQEEAPVEWGKRPGGYPIIRGTADEEQKRQQQEAKK